MESEAKVSRRPHDQFFKDLMFDAPVAKDFFEANLPPEILNLLDLETLELTTNTVIDSKLNARYTDILYKVLLRNGGSGYIFFTR